MSSQRSLRDIGELLKGRRYLVIGVALGCLFTALLGTFFLPKHYEAVAKVRLVDNDVLGAVYGHAPGSLDGRVKVATGFRRDIKDRKLIASAVEEVATAKATIVDSLAGATAVEEVPGATGKYLFNVTMTAAEPDIVHAILNRVLAGYEKSRFTSRQSNGQEELAALATKTQVLGQDLEEAGRKLESFLREHGDHRFGESNDTASRLEAKRSELAGVKKEIDTLSKRLADIREQLAEEDEWRDAEEGEESTGGKVRSEVWSDLRKTERVLLSEMAVKERMRKAHADRVAGLEERVRAFPGLESEWKVLTAHKAGLEEDLTATSAELESRTAHWKKYAAESAVVFSVIERPDSSHGGGGSKRLMLSLAGLVIGLCGGFGAVLVMSMTDKSFRSTDEVAATMDIPVLGAIARIETPAEREDAKRKQKRAAVLVVALAVLVGVALVAQLVFDEPISTFVRDTVSLSR